jgi:hypothetical protein
MLKYFLIMVEFFSFLWQSNRKKEKTALIFLGFIMLLVDDFVKKKSVVRYLRALNFEIFTFVLLLNSVCFYIIKHVFVITFCRYIHKKDTKRINTLTTSIIN